MATIRRSALLSVILFCVAVPAYAGDDELTAEARQLVNRFVGELKPALKQALQEGGPVHAIKVCSTTAPTIARSLSESSGWSIRRVSLKPRNVNNALPDSWERGVLEAFEGELAMGVPIADMVRIKRDDREFRFIKPQAVEAVCLACHGENLDPAVSAALGEYAPGDTATGYRLGQIRGAFSLRRTLVPDTSRASGSP